MKNKQKNVIEEAAFFLNMFNGIEKSANTKMVPYDDFKAQTEYWCEKLSQEMNLKMLLHQPLDVEVVKTILALDSNTSVKNDLIKLINVNTPKKELPNV